jgi:hypothetical protein
LVSISALAPALLAAACNGAPPGETIAPIGARPGLAPGGRTESRFLRFRAPAGDQPTTLATTIDGRSGAILPNGRFVTPAGTEVTVGAPKPFGLAVAPDERHRVRRARSR